MIACFLMTLLKLLVELMAAFSPWGAFLLSGILFPAAT